MKRLLGCLLVVGVVGCGDASSSSRQAQPDNSAVRSATRDAQAKVENGSPAAPRTAADGPDVQTADADPLAALEKLGAVIKRDDPQIISVEGGDDGRLAELVFSLRGEVIKVTFNGSQITDEGLVHLTGMTDLRALDLTLCTNVTDAGLVHLKQLTKLEELVLNGTQITDAGLVHLAGLTKLKLISLPKQVTDAGIAELQKALPNCTIEK